MDYVIGVDVGASKIHSALITFKGEIIKEYRTLTEPEKPREVLIGKIKHSIEEVWKDDVKGIGIGVPGPIEQKTNKIYPTNIKNLKGIMLVNFLKKFKVPIKVNNDAKCFILAEHRFGTAKNYKNVVGLTLGTGVGGGVIINNELYYGKDGAAGELGHIIIDKDGYQCNCGNHGCLEVYVSGTAIESRTIQQLRAKNTKSTLNPKDVTALKIYFAALKGDKLAKTIMEETGVYLGIGITNIINAFNPDIIVLGGSVAKIFPAIRKSLYQTINERGMFPAKKVRIVPTALKHPGTLGAAVLIIDELTKKEKIDEDEQEKPGNKGKKKFFGLF